MTFVNPEPLAPFADVIAAGEAEVLVHVARTRVPLGDRKARPPRELAAERGFYIPSFYEPRYRADGVLEAMEPVAGTNAPVRCERLR